VTDNEFNATNRIRTRFSNDRPSGKPPDQIPYVKLPSGTYRISQSALLASLQSNYDLSGDLAFLDERAKGISEQDVIDALEDD
jgi:hypothetical protein